MLSSISSAGSAQPVCSTPTLPPYVAFDSRFGPRPDGGVGRVKANTPYALPLAGSWVPTEAEAVLVNLTVASSLGPGFLLAYPCGTDPPVASNVNFLSGEDRAGSTMVGLGPDGTLCLLSNVDVHIIVDISGYFEPAKFGPKPTIQPFGGLRVVDSRTGVGGWSTRLAAGETRAFDPTPNAPAGDNSYAAMLNVIATEAAGAGHLRVFPCVGTAPLVSTVNFSTTGEATNLITVAADHDGLICVFASTATQVVIDEFALLQAPGLARRLTVTGATPFPTFDPTGQDYAMICPAAGGDLSIDALGTSQVDVTIDGSAVTGIADTTPCHRSVPHDQIHPRRGGVGVHAALPAIRLPAVHRRPPWVATARLVSRRPGLVDCSHRSLPGDPRQPRCADLVQAHGSVRPRPEDVDERELGVDATAGPGLRHRHQSRLPSDQSRRLVGCRVEDGRITDGPSRLGQSSERQRRIDHLRPA